MNKRILATALVMAMASSGVMALSERERVFLEQLARDDAR